MRFLIVIGLFTGSLGGCATDNAASTETADLKKRLDDALKRQAQSEQKLEALEDRVFLLTDQLESQKVASARTPAPRLPVVRLQPSEASAAVEDAPPAPVQDKVSDGSGSWFDDGRKVRRLASRKEPRPEPPRLEPKSAPIGDSLGVAPVPQIPATAPSEDPMKAYRVAYEDLRAGKHDVAAGELREFVRKWPRHDLADNAQYWLGESFYARKRWNEAAAEFRATVDKWPLGNKAPDALVKLGFCLQAMGEQRAARDVLAQVGQSYPRTDAARLAEVRLAELSHMPEEKP
jgi:tol-pal system protein YbgF